MRRLRQVAVTLVLIPVFLAVSLIPILPKPAYAASQAPPAEVPEDPLGQQSEKQEPDISINVDVRDGHLTVRVVDMWGPGRRPLVVRSLTNALTSSGISAGPWQFNLLMDVLPDDPVNTTKWFVREPDGNRGTYKPNAALGAGVWEKKVGSYATMTVAQSCPGGQCSITSWTVQLSKGVTVKFLPNAKINQVGAPNGLLKEIRDANGNVTTATWTTFGDGDYAYIEKLTDPVGRVTTFTYARGPVVDCIGGDGASQLKQPATAQTPPPTCRNIYAYLVKTITDPYGRTATYGYTSTHQIDSVLNAAGFTTRYGYAPAPIGLLNTVTDARGNTTTIEWGPSGTTYAVTRVAAPDGSATAYAYPALDTTRVTDARTYATTYTHSNKEIRSVTDPVGNITSYVYDSRHNVTQVTDPRGIVTTYTYNTRNKVTQVVQDAGTGRLNLTTTMTWDSNDNLLTVTNPRGVRTEYTYNATHNLTQVKKAAGTADESITTYTYTTWGGVATVSNPRNAGWVWTYAYTARRQVASITPPAGGATSFTYNFYDDQDTKTDGAGHTWTTAYNPSRLVLSVTDPLTNKIINAYDANGNKTSVTDPKNQVTSFTYDSRNRLTQITDPLTGQTRYFYDAVGNLARINNARAIDIATFIYDMANRLTQVKDALNQITTYTYDANGNRLTMQDRKGTTHSYTYDQANRLTQVSAGGTTFSYTYDANGNRLTLVDGTGTTSFIYDNLDRLTKTTSPDAKTVQFAYDVAGNRTSVTNPLPTQTTYGYDPANRLTSMVQGSLQWTFGYDAAGNRTTLTQPNGTSTTYAYLTNNWLSSITHKTPGGATLQAFSYTYDANGNRLTQADSTGTTSFGYDVLNRLTSAAYPAGYGSWTWAYDSVGNRLTQTAPGGTTTYSYDANNRLTNAGAVNYSYDANGNLASTSAGQSFSWDVFNRMSQATGVGGTATYTYNGDGLKIRRIGPDGTTRYYYDGIRPIWEADGAGSMTAQLDRDVFGNLLSRKEPVGTRRYYHFDGLGSTTALSDESGAPVATLFYDAWGNQRAASGTAVPNYRFTGAELDSASGLYHMGARFYDPAIGRWASEEPDKEYKAGAEQLNFYAYATNNPLLYVDPTGKIATTVEYLTGPEEVEWRCGGPLSQLSLSFLHPGVGIRPTLCRSGGWGDIVEQLACQFECVLALCVAFSTVCLAASEEAPPWLRVPVLAACIILHCGETPKACAVMCSKKTHSPRLVVDECI